MRFSLKNSAIRSFQIITIVIISIYFINMCKSVSALSISFSSHNIWSIVLSVGLLSVGFFLLPMPTFFLLQSVGKTISFVSSMKIFFFSEVGKYLPGKVWVAVGRIMMYSKMGVERERGIFILILELSVMIFTAIIFPGKIILHYITLKPTILAIFLSAIPVLLFLIIWKYHITVEKIKKYTIQFTIPAVIIFISFTFFWFILGCAFQCLIYYFTQINIGSFQAMQIFSASWVVGFLAFFMPVGLGVREVFMTELLIPVIGNQNALLIAVIARIWWTFIEVIFIAFSSGKMFSEFLKTNALPEIKH
jgi:hypothetical protein